MLPGPRIPVVSGGLIGTRRSRWSAEAAAPRTPPSS